ncbi:RcnB family protein [Sphingobium sp. AP49]|uniref:RcnB family protein n=1 Tax=Sphingobium sp. AP49 TaxID=1144307 RepID=UPI0009DB5A7B|nr:RcnB family protein [Sphingobium sp. AP49]WHO41097.1 RcnB family protein [Sphingobium sp. AP49]
MLAGLIGATLMSGATPVYAQRGNGGPQGEARGSAQRGYGNGPGAPQRAAPSQQWQGGGGRSQGPGASQRWQGGPSPAAGPEQRADGAGWRQPGDGRAVGQASSPRRPDGMNRPDRVPPSAQPAGRPDQAYGRYDGRGDRGPDRRGPDARPDARQDWGRNDRDDRPGRTPGDQRWNSGDNRYAAGNWNNGRRYDDRSRWAGQQRWDNGWRQDRRYDWYGYRARYGDRYRVGRYYAPTGWGYGYRSFSAGVYLSGLLYGNRYWIDDPYYYRLPPAYGTLRWIRYYDDALLVDVRDGYVVDAIRNFFW